MILPGVCPSCPQAGTIAKMPSAHGTIVMRGGALLWAARLPTDAIGTATVTLTNLVVGAAVELEVQSTGAQIELRTAASTSELFTVDLYAAGSANNDLRIKVRKTDTAPYYKPQESLVTITASPASIYIPQELDQ